MLEIKNLKKSFKISDSKSTLVLNNISYTFGDKGLYFVLGKSGSGKSTLLNICNGILNADEGEVAYNSKDIFKMSKKEKLYFLKNEIGTLFQHYNLLEDLSVYENLKVTESIKGIKCEDRINSLLQEYGLSDKKDQKVFNLSGGEKQRLALIRAILCKPKILFCDEPTGALDELNSIKIFELLKIVSKDILVIVVTHNNKMFKSYYDGYLFLENGSIKEKVLPKNEVQNNQHFEIAKTKKNKDFVFKIASKNMRKNINRGFLSTFSSFFSIIVLILSLFVKQGINDSRLKLLDTYGDKNTFGVSISKSENIENSNLSLERFERPTHNEVQTLLDDTNCYIDYSYDFFFKSGATILHGKNLEKKIVDFDMKPICLLDQPLNTFFVNNLLAKEIEVEPLLPEIVVTASTTYSYYESNLEATVTEVIDLSFPLLKGGVYNEFEYMNRPTLYYQTGFLEKVLKETPAKKTTAQLGELVTVYDLLVDASNTSELSSYKLNIFTFDDKSKSLVYEILEEKDSKKIFKIENYGYTMVKSFLDIANSVFLGMNIFLALAIVTTLFIVGFLAYSSAMLNRKESAILTSLGALNSDVEEIYVTEQLTFSTAGAFVGIVFSLLISRILNNQLFNFFKFDCLINVDWVVLILIFIIFLASTIIASLIPLYFTKRKNIAEELREE